MAGDTEDGKSIPCYLVSRQRTNPTSHVVQFLRPISPALPTQELNVLVISAWLGVDVGTSKKLSFSGSWVPLLFLRHLCRSIQAGLGMSVPHDCGGTFCTILWRDSSSRDVLDF